MTKMAPPPVGTKIIQNVPDLNTYTIDELISLNSEASEKYFKCVFDTLNKYNITSNNHHIVPTILAFPLFALQSNGYMNPKSPLKIKVKFGGKYKTYIINFDNSTTDEKEKPRKINSSIAKSISYDITDYDVPLIELLANAGMLNNDTVKQRLSWLKLEGNTFKITGKKEHQITIEGQIKHLIQDLAEYW